MNFIAHNITVIGEGAWGSAISHLLAHNGHNVTILCYDQNAAQQINLEHIHRIAATTDCKAAFKNCTWIFEAIPVKFLRSVITKCIPYATADHKWVILSKGIEKDTLLLPSQIVDNVLKFNTQKVVLSGPSFAYEVTKQQETAVNIASSNQELLLELKSIVDNNYFKTVISDDINGIEVCGAIKNVIAILIGLLDAYDCGDNLKAAVVTKSLAEIQKTILFFGGSAQTAYSLSGVGDLILTCFGKHSKNLKLGKSINLQDINNLISQPNLPEGINSLISINQLIKNNNLELPLLNQIHEIIFNGQSLESLFDLL